MTSTANDRISLERYHVARPRLRRATARIPGATKVVVALEPDEDGYPPYAVETMWAVPIGEGVFRLENTPFFAVDLAAGDLIRTELSDGEYWVVEVVQPSGHWTIRVVPLDGTEMEKICNLLRDAGCSLERFRSLVAADVPPGDPIRTAQLMDTLSSLESQGAIGFDVGCRGT